MANLFCPLHRLDHNIMGKSLGFDVQLYCCDAVDRPGDLKIHIAEMVFLAKDICQQFISAILVANHPN